MKRRRDRQDHGALRSRLRSQLDGALYRAGVPRDDRLVRRIQIRRRADFAVRGALANVGNHRMGQTHNCSHRAHAVGNRVLHVRTALAYQPHGVRKLPRPGTNQRGIFTEAVARDKIRLQTLFRQHAGHRLGEYSALVCAGSLKFADAVRLVRKRGAYMQDAVSHGVGAMAAIMGLSHAVVADVCKRAADGEVCAPANLNSPDQTVISGHAGAVKRAVELASQAGAKRAVILPVSAPFHSALMAPIEEKFALDLRGAEFSDLRVPLVTNVDADTISTASEAREALIRQVSMPVRWEESVRLLLDEGVNTFVEVGSRSEERRVGKECR